LYRAATVTISSMNRRPGAGRHGQTAIRFTRERIDRSLDLGRVAYVDRHDFDAERRGHRLDDGEQALARTLRHEYC
jgi:hypothetical protein